MTRFSNAAAIVGIVSGFLGLSTAVGWCGYTLLCMVGFHGRAIVPVMLVLGLHPVVAVLLGIASADGPPELIRNSALLRRLPRTVHLIITLLAGLVVAVGVMVGVAWCGARLLHAAHFRYELPLWGAFTFSFVAVLLSFFAVRYLGLLLGDARDYVSLRWGAGRHTEPTPLTPEELEMARRWEVALSNLRAAVARGVCPECGAGGFQGREAFAHRRYSAGRDGRGFMHETVYELHGQCPACGYARKLPFMR
jgi:hypothetical protein